MEDRPCPPCAFRLPRLPHLLHPPCPRFGQNSTPPDERPARRVKRRAKCILNRVAFSGNSRTSINLPARKTSLAGVLGRSWAIERCCCAGFCVSQDLRFWEEHAAVAVQAVVEIARSFAFYGLRGRRCTGVDAETSLQQQQERNTARHATEGTPARNHAQTMPIWDAYIQNKAKNPS